MRARLSFNSVLAASTAASTFMLVVFGVFADELIAEFEVERWRIGILVTAASGFSGLISPTVGRGVDRIGARRMTVLTLLGSGIALAAIGLAPAYWLLLAAAMLTAVPQAMVNPATNKLIGEHVAPGSRGLVTGIKQSGVQVGVFVGGAALPVIAEATDWRVAVIVFAAGAFAVAGVAAATLPSDPPAPQEGEAVARSDGSLPPLVRRVTLYGFLLGAGGSAIFTYLPLYAEEGLGFTDQAAGWAVSVMGLVGIGARIGWGRAAEHRFGAFTSLRAMAVIAVAAALLLLAAGTGAAWIVWIAAIVTGLSASAWNAVGMLAIIQGLPASDTGRASGQVMFGFLAGLGLGAPAFGWSVDLTGSYVLGWSAAAVVFAASLVGLAGASDPATTESETAVPKAG